MSILYRNVRFVLKMKTSTKLTLNKPAIKSLVFPALFQFQQRLVTVSGMSSVCPIFEFFTISISARSDRSRSEFLHSVFVGIKHLFGFFTISKSDRSDRNEMQFLRMITILMLKVRVI